MTRLEWGEGPPRVDRGVDRGVLYLPNDGVDWSELLENGDIGEEVSLANTTFDRIDLGGSSSSRLTEFVEESRFGDKSLRMYAEAVPAGYRNINLHQQLNVASQGEVSLWFNLKGATGHWGRFEFFYGMSDGLGNDPFGRVIINQYKVFDGGIDDYIIEYRIYVESNFSGGVWQQIATFDLESWYKLTIKWALDTMTFKVHDETLTLIVSEDLPCDSAASVADGSGNLDVSVTAWDEGNLMDILIDNVQASESYYLDPNLDVIPWYGLVSIEEQADGELTKDHYDGRNFRTTQRLGSFTANVQALSYPQELDPFIGVDGFHDKQPRKWFGLHYRTGVEDDQQLHIVYNATIKPSTTIKRSLNKTPTIETLSWDLVTVPIPFVGTSGISHLVIHLNEVRYPEALQEVLDILYGSDWSGPARLPTPDEVVGAFEAYVTFRVTDLGDGTWMAEGPDEWISVDEDGVYEISSPTALPYGPNSHVIGSY